MLRDVLNRTKKDLTIEEVSEISLKVDDTYDTFCYGLVLSPFNSVVINSIQTKAKAGANNDDDNRRRRPTDRTTKRILPLLQ